MVRFRNFRQTQSSIFVLFKSTCVHSVFSECRFLNLYNLHSRAFAKWSALCGMCFRVHANHIGYSIRRNDYGRMATMHTPMASTQQRKRNWNTRQKKRTWREHIVLFEQKRFIAEYRDELYMWGWSESMWEQESSVSNLRLCSTCESGSYGQKCN